MVSYNLRGINKTKAAGLLEKLANEHLFNNPNSIIDSIGGIQAFGKYNLYKKDNSVVIYINKVKTLELSCNKTALCWCIADKYKRHRLANNIQFYDNELSNRQSDVLFFKNILEANTNHQNKEAVFARLKDTQLKVKWLKQQLNNCLNSAKYCQQKGFENETSRLGLNPRIRKIAEGV